MRRGWTAFEETGLKDKLMERYYAGALLIGISAGAIQLGLKGWDEDGAVRHPAPGAVRRRRPRRALLVGPRSAPSPRRASMPAASASPRAAAPSTIPTTPSSRSAIR